MVHILEAIWTYLSPVFPWLEQQVPQGIRRMNVFGDGPVTLRDYINAIHPQGGFNGEGVQGVQKATASLKAHH